MKLERSLLALLRLDRNVLICRASSVPRLASLLAQLTFFGNAYFRARCHVDQAEFVRRHARIVVEQFVVGQFKVPLAKCR
jgi:hypothetical protein